NYVTNKSDLVLSSRRRHTRFSRDWSSDVCSSDLWCGAAASVGSSTADARCTPAPPSGPGSKTAEMLPSARMFAVSLLAPLPALDTVMSRRRVVPALPFVWPAIAGLALAMAAASVSAQSSFSGSGADGESAKTHWAPYRASWTLPPSVDQRLQDPILAGAIDLHAHHGPDAYPRQWDAFEVAELAASRGMRAIVIKNHWTET